LVKIAAEGSSAGRLSWIRFSQCRAVVLLAVLGEAMRLAAILVLYLALAACASRSPDSLVVACDRAGDDVLGFIHSVRICTDAISSGVLTPSQEAQVLADRGR
jgi:hypothetical protein